MKWQKRGLVWAPDGTKPWARSHAMCPTPIQIDEDTLRIFVGCHDDNGRGHITYVDVFTNNPTEIKNACGHPVLEPGRPGAFDDNGVLPLSAVRNGDEIYLYYVGFELCRNIRYRMFIGLAISRNNGESFERYSDAAVLDRTGAELYFRCGPICLKENDRFRLWYVAGSDWTEIEGKSVPVYNLRYAESDDGKNWPTEGQVVLDVSNEDEHGFGRPWIIHEPGGLYKMYYSIRRRSLRAYRLGYAESTDGLNWIRKDSELGLDVSTDDFDSHAIMYSAVVNSSGKTYCFYNGNNFGEDGFALAELAE